jgi:hypothetical protein
MRIEARFRPCPRYINRKAWDLRVGAAVTDQHQEQDHHEDSHWHYPSDWIIGVLRS